MPSPGKASIKLLDAVDDGTEFSVDDVPQGSPFDVLANVEIGENLNEVVDSFVLRVGIQNLTQSNQVAVQEKAGNLTPQNNTPFFDQVRVDFADTGTAAVGDVLQAVASYTVKAGATTDFSTALSNTFVVS